MDALFDAFTALVTALAAAALAHFGVALEGLELRAPAAHAPVVRRSPPPPDRLAVVGPADATPSVPTPGALAPEAWARER